MIPTAAGHATPTLQCRWQFTAFVDFIEAPRAMSSPARALSVQPWWAAQILNGNKTCAVASHTFGSEWRSLPWAQASCGGEITIAGRKVIAEKDAGGTLILVADAVQAYDKHRVADLAALGYTRVYAWILQDPVWYSEPKSYRHPPGCQNWIPLVAAAPPSPPPKTLRKRPAAEDKVFNAGCHEDTNEPLPKRPAGAQ